MKNLSISVKVRPSQTRAFTIIELLVVVAIIAVLTGIIMTSLTGSKTKARDTKRISDVGSIQLALELYFDRCKEYPNVLDVNETNTYCSSLSRPVSLGTYVSTIPKDPSGSDYDYIHNSDKSSYIIHTQLELTNGIIKDGLSESARIAPSPAAYSWANGASFNCYDSSSHNRDYCLVPR